MAPHLHLEKNKIPALNKSLCSVLGIVRLDLLDSKWTNCNLM